MKKFIIVFAYWWCIMYPSLGLDIPQITNNFSTSNQKYQFKLKIVDCINELHEKPFSVKSSS